MKGRGKGIGDVQPHTQLTMSTQANGVSTNGDAAKIAADGPEECALEELLLLGTGTSGCVSPRFPVAPADRSDHSSVPNVHCLTRDPILCKVGFFLETSLFKDSEVFVLDFCPFIACRSALRRHATQLKTRKPERLSQRARTCPAWAGERFRPCS